MHADPVARPQYFDIRLGRPKRRARHGELHEPTAGTGYTSHHHRQDDVDHERVHRRAAEIPDALRKAVHRGEVCESCDDLVMNAVATAASGVGPVQLRHNVWPHVRMRLPAPGGVSSTSNWYDPEGRRSACARWLFQRFGDDSLFRPRSVRKQLQCVD